MNVLMMPGIDALDSRANRLLCLEIPEAVQCLRQTQKILDDIGYDMDVFEVMRAEPRAEFSWYHQMMICSFSVQIGLFRRFEKTRRKIDAVFSMSLGDIPRCVCVDAASYESALVGLVRYLRLTDSLVDVGNTLQVILPRPYEKMKHLLKLEQYNVEISVDQSDYFFLLAGRVEDIERWDREVGSQHKITVRRPFSVRLALHHPLMDPVFEGLHDHIHESAHYERMKYPVFSTVLGKYIENRGELIEDIERTIRSTVKFKDSVNSILQKHKTVNFINIGPAPTMLLFLDYCYLKGNYTTEDFFVQTVQSLGLEKPPVPLKKRMERKLKSTVFKINKHVEGPGLNQMTFLSNTWKILKGIFLALRVLLRPNGGIFALIELGNVIEDIRASSLAAEIIMKDPEAKKLIDERYSRGLPDIATLGTYSDGSLGKELHLHLTRLDSMHYPVPLQPGYSAQIYIRERRREIHDLLHVVTGYDTTYKNEACLNAFIASQGPMPICILIPIGVMLRYIFKFPAKLDELCSALAAAWQRGKAANSIFSIRWEEYLDRPLEEARAALFVTEPQQANDEIPRMTAIQ